MGLLSRPPNCRGTIWLIPARRDICIGVADGNLTSPNWLKHKPLPLSFRWYRSLVGQRVTLEMYTCRLVICNFNGGEKILKNQHRRGLKIFKIKTPLDQALAMMLVGTFSQSELDLHFCCVQDEVVEARFESTLKSGAVEKLCRTPVSEQRMVTATASLAVNQCRKRLFPFFGINISFLKTVLLFRTATSQKSCPTDIFFSHFLWGNGTRTADVHMIFEEQPRSWCIPIQRYPVHTSLAEKTDLTRPGWKPFHHEKGSLYIYNKNVCDI